LATSVDSPNIYTDILVSGKIDKRELIDSSWHVSLLRDAIPANLEVSFNYSCLS